jgi:hypothetical protein
MYKTQDLIDNIVNVRNNPALIQRYQLEALEAAMNGTLDVVDASNPFVFLIEANAATAAATVARAEAVTRRLYPSLAVTEDDLYRHMSDVDYLGRFSLPDNAQMVLALSWAELLVRVVQVPGSDVKKLVIPRNTKFKINGVEFGMQYPIEIRLMPHGGFQVVYLNDIPSPLWTLTTNLVPWSRTKIKVDDTYDWWMLIPIDTKQFTLTTSIQQLSSLSGYNKNFTLTDNYYFTRVYGLASDGVTWIEYLTTHSDQVYDAKSPTAKLKVADGKLNVYIPQIYFTSGMLGAALRVDIYTTKGPLNMNLSEYSADQFEMECIDLDTEAQTAPYVAPVSSITGAVYSSSKTSGGSLPIDFATLREKVIKNSTYVNTPITGQQLETSQEINGFKILKAKDNITSRLYAASKALPIPSSGRLKAGAGALMGTLETSLEDLATRSTVIDNTTSVTLTPKTLFELRSNVLTVMSQADYNRISGYASGQNWDDLLVEIEQKGREIVYTPFHYVLDTVDNQFDMRAYHLESPAISSRNFDAENPATLLLAGTGNVTLTRTETGYLLTVIADTGPTYKSLADSQVHLQLAYKPVGEDDYAFVTATLVGKMPDSAPLYAGERVFQFVLDTTYFINRSDQIQFKGFSLFEGNLVNTLSELNQQFYLVWSVSDYTGANDIPTTDIDSLVYKRQVPSNAIGVTQESLTLSFGTPLTYLWRRARTVKDSVQYKRYDTDIPDVYQQVVYETDDLGQLVLRLNNTTQKYESIVLHNAGDPKLDANGNPTVLHRKGEPILDSSGNPIEMGPRSVVRHVDLMLIDGRFYFATDPDDVAYRVELANSVVGYLDSIADINDQLLENTELYYVPVTTLGDITVLIGAGLETTISSTQSFVIRLYLSQANYNNTPLKESMEDKCNQLVHDTLQQSTFSVDGLGSVIKDTLGDDIMAADVDPLGPNKTLNVFTSTDDITRCSVKRKNVVLPQGTLQVQDDILVDTVRHQRVDNTVSSDLS